MLEISEVENVSDYRQLIGFDGNCVTQVLGELPSTALLRQACFFFFQFFEKKKIKDPTLYFLTLLASTDQIGEALSRYGRTRKYLVKCCRGDWKCSAITIKDWQERLALSTNAILSLD